MVLAAIDIGSNAVRLLFAHIFTNSNGEIDFEKSAYIRIPLRLGEDVFSGGFISEEKSGKLLKVMQTFKALIDVAELENFDACATSAMRNAANGTAVAALIEKETGIKVRIIGGQEEAAIIRAAGENYELNKFPTSLYVDVGGGSTEISIIHDHKFVNSCSFEIGTVRLLQGETDEKEWQKMDQWLLQYKSYFGKMNCVGSGGNINKIGKLYGSSNKVVSAKKMNKIYKILKSMTLQERIDKIGLRPDRADVIVPAAHIFCHILQVTGCKSVVAPKFGLADGMVCQMYRNLKKK